MIKVPKLDLIVENYLFLLQREKDCLNRKHIDTALRQILETAEEGKVEVSEIKKLLSEIEVMSAESNAPSKSNPNIFLSTRSH
jgi:hypothetical protein